MGRAAKHNWRNLFLEYNKGRYKSVAEFAEAKGLYPDRVRKEFRKLEKDAGQQVQTSPKNESKQVKKTDSVKPGKSKDPWEKLKRQFTDWPEEKLQAYVTQLNARKEELEAIPFEELTPAEVKELGQIRRERRVILSNPDPEKICKAVRNGKKCNNPVERGMEVCWNHGGAPGTGTQPGQKHALKHGAYEAIWFDTLDDKELEIINKLTQDNIRRLEEDIELLTIRERRMMARIARLTGAEYTVIKIKREKGEGHGGYIDKNSTEEQATLGQVQEIERELTKVQEKRLKAIELRHKFDQGRPPDGISVVFNIPRPPKQDITGNEG